jgi:uncharacterized protein
MNKLAEESSPYLRQHKDNPVSWLPWSETAFGLAKSEDKPVFLSIGYSTCHWCHVMAKESFANEDIAKHLNDTFICIKVDREERPDLDHIYMKVCQMMTGHGGWPLTVLLTPEKKPFWSGTYLPPVSTEGRLSVVQLCSAVKQSWESQREEILEAAEKSTTALLQGNEATGDSSPSENVFRNAYQYFAANYDSLWGGFGRSPKFPSPQNLMFLLRYGQAYEEPLAIQMVKETISSMLRGGIYDQVEGGFHRYSTDRFFQLPHFEKMLYDQAMMILILTEIYQLTAEDLFKKKAEETANYVLNRLKSESGMFFAALDAETNGEEGIYYQWSTSELSSLLTKEEYAYLDSIMDLKEEGNFLDEASRVNTGKNILFFKKNVNINELDHLWDTIRNKCKNARDQRDYPGTDDKLLTDWNGLIVAALAKIATISENTVFLKAAEDCWQNLYETNNTGGQLLHCKSGKNEIIANLDDSAFLLWGTFELYQVTLDEKYLKASVIQGDELISNFYEEGTSVFHFSSGSKEDLIVRTLEIHDGAIPSGFGTATYSLLRLGYLIDKPDWISKSLNALKKIKDDLEKVPWGHCMSLITLLLEKNGTEQLILTSEKEKYLRTLWKGFHPDLTVAFRAAGDSLADLLEYTTNMSLQENLAYLCQNKTCNLPAKTPDELLTQLR